jgi:putative NADH-flavin reductase
VKRVLYVGGASSLEVAPGKVLADQPGFPDASKAEAREGRQALSVWRSEAEGLDWTYLSPAEEIGPGERTGKYRTTGDRLLTDSAGKSSRSRTTRSRCWTSWSARGTSASASGWRTDVT